MADEPAGRTPAEDRSRVYLLRRLVRMERRAARAVVGWKRVRSAHADARARRAAPCACQPRRQRQGTRERATPLRARDPWLPGMGHVAERDADRYRLR